MAWTDKQKQAIDSREGNFLVSAGAGSGKTAVLTQRITDIIASKQAKISEFLVLTFSNKAAHEMKTRIRKSLKKNGMDEESEQVELADITTFDAYARRIVIKYSDKLGIDPNFNVIDETYLETLKRHFLDEIIEEGLSNQRIKKTFERFSIKNCDNIIDLVMKLQKFADKYGDRLALYESLIKRVTNKEWVDVCLNELYSNINFHIHECLNLIDQYQNDDAAEADRAIIAPFADLKTYDAFYKLSSQTPVKFKIFKGDAKLDSFTNSVRQNVKDEFRSYLNLAKSLGDSNNQRARLGEMSDDIISIIVLSRNLDDQINLFKGNASAWTFADVFSFACRAVRDKEIREEIASKYKFIMVDEYQDTNMLQENFIKAIARNNVFAVGDIKQSIYRFRNAEPSIFAGKFEAYGKNIGGTLIKLQDNFRSRKEVVDDINSIFSGCMSDELGSVDYAKGHSFNWGNKDAYGSTCSEEHNCEILLYSDHDKKSQLNDQEREAMVIANDIISKLENHYQVLGSDGKMRDCRPSDFAILISRKTNFPVYKKIFAECKIPLAASDDNNISLSNVSMALISFIRLFGCVDGETDELKNAEKFYYVSLMRSYVCNKSDKDIFDSIKSGAYRISPVFEMIRKNRDRLTTLSVKDAVSEMLHMLPFVDNLKYVGDVTTNYEVLKAVVNTAANIDAIGGSMLDLLQYFDDLDEYGLKLSVKESGDSGDGVQLMSVHASKGLEFPIIYCPDLARKTNKDECKGGFLIDDVYGMALPKTKCDEYSLNMLHYLISQRVGAEAISEFLRLFYVGLTRAKEKIILVLKKHEDFDYTKITNISLLKTSCSTDKNGEEVVKTSVLNADSFEKFLAISEKKIKTVDVIVTKPKELSAQSVVVEDSPAPIFRTIKVLPIIKDRKKASKTSVEPIDEGALAYGTRLHRLLEIVDFNTKDTSFITNDKEKTIIDKVLSLPVFDDVADAKVYHEYAFFDEEENIHGSIDLLMVYKDHAYIIDFKTKHIDDPAYLKQLSIYKNFVEKKFGLRAHTGLLSIIGAEFKSVE